MYTRPHSLPAASLLAALLAAGHASCLAQTRHATETPTGSAVFADGVLVEALNRLTGETYSLPRPDDRATGLLRPRDRTLWLGTAAQRTPGADGSQTARWDDGSALTTTVEAAREGNDLIVRQSGRSGSELWGCQWGIAGLSDRQVSLIVPAWSGIRLDRGAPFREGVFDWPTGWEAQMVIVQGRQGGLWIRADDPDDRFKGLWIRHRSGAFDLGFRTYSEGPLAERTTVESVAWRVGFYRGDWRVPARDFRDWMARTAGRATAPSRRPAWADEIRSVIILPTSPQPDRLAETRAVLRKLTEWATPRKTLLYTFNWRRDTYDLNYPDYTAHEGFKELVDFAHQLGYRVMPHTCYYGVNLENPEYQRLKPYHMRDLFSGDLITYLWPPAKPVSHIAMLHPGAKAWRELYVAKCREIAERYGIDSLHLDVTLAMPNVTERADGLNTIQGNVAFHRDLREALPGVALGGEGLNEVSCRNEAFAQTHGGFAVTMGPDTLARIANDSGVDCSHPISAYLLSPFTRWYGYLGYPPPSSSALYRGWTRAYENWGVAPTLSSPTLAELEHPSPDLRVRLEEMRLVDRYDLRPDFDADLVPAGPRTREPQTKCLWRGRGGAKLVYDHEDHGGTHAWFADATGAHRTVYRYLRGRTTFPGEGSIGPWAAFDHAGLYGLDPDRTYLWEPRAPDHTVPHLLRLPEGLTLHGFRHTDDFLLFDLATRAQAIDLRRRFAEANVGIVVGGREQSFGDRAQFEETRASCGGESKDGLFAHPPWDDEHGVIGSVFAEWTLRVPQGGKPALTFSFGLRDGAEKGDGVTFAVRVDGKLLLQQDRKRCEWLPCRVDLTPYAGQEVKLRLSVDKGPEGRGAYAWAVWGEPRIVVEPTPEPLSVEGLAARKVVAAAGPSAQASCTLAGREGRLDRYRVETQAPGATCLFFRRPPPAALPLDLLLAQASSLRSAPFTWTPVVDGLALPQNERPAYLSAGVGEGRSGGVTKPALLAHPPIDGSTAVDYLLTLPRGAPAELRFSTAIQEGAETTNGIAFLVAANGNVLSRQEVTRPEGWHEGRADLSAYAGETVLLSLIVDARGDATCDWARWGEPRIVARQ